MSLLRALFVCPNDKEAMLRSNCSTLLPDESLETRSSSAKPSREDPVSRDIVLRTTHHRRLHFFVAPYSKAAYQRALRVYRLVHGAHRPWARRVVATLKALHAPDVDSADECGFCGACPPAVKLGQGHSVYRGQGEVNAWCLLIHAGSLCVSVAFTMYSPFAFQLTSSSPKALAWRALNQHHPPKLFIAPHMASRINLAPRMTRWRVAR